MKMNLQWISTNARLESGITLINSINTVKFKLLLTHITQAKNDEVFTENELEKLKDSLKLTAENLQLLLQSIAYILKQAGKVILKPTVLQNQLVEILKFDPEKADEFVKIWSGETKSDFGDLENRLKVKQISWELNLQTASTFCNKQAIPQARLQFDLNNISGEKSDKVLLELDEEELVHLYNTLENIQIKLDNIQTMS